ALQGRRRLAARDGARAAWRERGGSSGRRRGCGGRQYAEAGAVARATRARAAVGLVMARRGAAVTADGVAVVALLPGGDDGASTAGRTAVRVTTVAAFDVAVVAELPGVERAVAAGIPDARHRVPCKQTVGGTAGQHEHLRCGDRLTPGRTGPIERVV